MSIYSVYRCLSFPYRLHPHLCFSPILIRPYNTRASTTETYLEFLQSIQDSRYMEKALTKVKGKLDSSIVEETLKRCSMDGAVISLRFFIWAGIQPDYRHRAYMYKKACNFIEAGSKTVKSNTIEAVINDVLESYKREGCVVSNKMFKVIFNLCREGKLREESLRVLRKMGEFGCRPDTTIYNVVIGLFCENGDMDTAKGLMTELGLMGLYPDMSSYMLMVKGLCGVGRLREACGLVKVMRDHGCIPNVVVYSTLIDGSCNTGEFDEALELLGQMEEDGTMPNVVTYTSVVQRLCEKGRTMEAQRILDRMCMRRCFPNRVTVATLVKHLCSEGNVEEAYKLIDKVVAYGSVSRSECYSSFIVSLVRNNNLDEAKRVFSWMLGNQIRPDGLACSILIKQLCIKGEILNGFEHLVEIEKLDLLSSVDSDLYSILLARLCEEGHFVEAATLGNVMVNRKIKLKALYADTVIASLQNSGEMELALHLKNEYDHTDGF